MLVLELWKEGEVSIPLRCTFLLLFLLSLSTCVTLRTLNLNMDTAGGELRHRKAAASDRDDEASVADAGERRKPEKKPESSVKDGKQLQPGTYWLTRIVFTRALGFIYCELSAAWSAGWFNLYAVSLCM